MRKALEFRIISLSWLSGIKKYTYGRDEHLTRPAAVRTTNIDHHQADSSSPVVQTTQLNYYYRIGRTNRTDSVTTIAEVSRSSKYYEREIL